MRIRIGTRGSQLARAQTALIADALQTAGAAVETVVLRTTGDRIPGELGPEAGRGVFTHQLEQALVDREIDLAVHSLKDLPTSMADGLVLAAVPTRADPRDALVSLGASALADLPDGSRVGTSSIRRQARIRNLYPGLEPVASRGNVDTRLRKLDEGEYDAIVLALAGLARLGSDRGEPIPIDVMLPAPAQGALGLQTRAGDPAAGLVSRLDDPLSRAAVTAERAVMSALESGCHVPIGALAEVQGVTLHLRAIVLSADGARAIEAAVDGDAGAPEAVGTGLAEQLRALGAAELL